MGHRTGKFKWRVERKGELARGDSLAMVEKETVKGLENSEHLATLNAVEDQQMGILWEFVRNAGSPAPS